MLWNLECPVGLSQREIWRNLDGPPKNKEVWSYVVKFEFNRPKSAFHYDLSRPLIIND